MTIYNFTAIDGNQNSIDFKQYSGQVLLIVNTASKCGFTKQYKGLEELHQRLSSKGFSVIAFPCNQFGAQEPGDMQEIQNFCSINYDVSFPIMQKIDVNGVNASPIFDYLTKAKPGLFGRKIKWNFTKFLIGRDGKVIARYAPTTEPEKIALDIEQALQI